MSENNPFLDLCGKIRFRGDISNTFEQPNASRMLREYAAKMRARGLIISDSLTPRLYQILCATAERLRLRIEPEAYVLPDPAPNAFAPIFGARDCPLIVLTSGIVELLTPSELQFVIENMERPARDCKRSS